MSSVSGRDSSAEPLEIGDSFYAATRRQQKSPGTGASHVWLDGEVLSCACPDCAAPMSIRLWLRLAECRMCGAQVELTEEQERAALELLAKRERNGGPAPPAPWSSPASPRTRPAEVKSLPILNPPRTATSTPAAPPATSKPIPAPQPAGPLIAEPVIDEKPPIVSPPPRVAPPRPVEQKSKRRSLLEYVIASLVSLLVNMLLIILLGLLTFPQLRRPDVILIEVDMKPAPAGPKGGIVVVKPLNQESVGNNPITPIVAPPSKRVTMKIEELVLPAVDTGELRKKIEASAAPNLPLPSALGTGGAVAGTLLAGRDPLVRNKVLQIEGGTERSEMAVAMGLSWLAKHQSSDGSWRLHAFHEAQECRGRCDDMGVTCNTAGTALALLPFLGAGFTHRGDHEYRETVQKGLDWLIEQQQDDGSLMGRPVFGNTGMYAHGQATMALCEAYALTRDSKLREAAQKGINFIVKAQHSKGGWRYAPGMRGDTSVVGWQIMALRSAQMAGLHVPESVIKKSNEFLTGVQKSNSEALYSYMEGSSQTETMTAEGLLCRLYSGWRTNFPPLLHGVDWLLKRHLPDESDSNMYYWYYATQVMHHVGGDRWNKWNERMRPLLIEMQEKEGHQTGSWTPMGHYDATGGRLYMTALAVCTLEVYYRHLPIYKNQALVGIDKPTLSEKPTLK